MLDAAVLPLLWRAQFLPQQTPERFEAAFPFARAGRPGQTQAEGEDAALMAPGLMLSALNYANCKRPVRIFGGDKDIVVNNRLHGRQAARLLPDGAYTELPGLGHMIHHFAQAPIAEAVAALANA
jgi:pimeloyl-ACP methyl ester carboxylesterase